MKQQLQCHVPECTWPDFKRYGKYEQHTHGTGKLKWIHTLQQYFCDNNHENWDSVAY